MSTRRKRCATAPSRRAQSRITSSAVVPVVGLSTVPAIVNSRPGQEEFALSPVTVPGRVGALQEGRTAAPVGR
ncbi:hypothetical protein [Streptomyces sp. NPDC003710]